MSRRVSPAQLRALEAVAAGRIYHRHPFYWHIGLTDLDTVRPRTLEGLANKKLIRVKIWDAEPEHRFDREVVLMPEGTAALTRARGDAA